MPQDFVPFFPQAAQPGGAAQIGHNPKPALRNPATTPPGGFEPLRTPPANAATPAPHTGHGKPVITVDREGDTITFIRVQCPCGLVTELKCTY